MKNKVREMEYWTKNAKGRENQYHLELNHCAVVTMRDDLYVDSACDSMDTVIRLLFSWFLWSNEINVCHNIGRVLSQISSYCIFLESMGLLLSTAIIWLPPLPPNQVLIMSSKTLIQPSTSVCALLEHVITSH